MPPVALARLAMATRFEVVLHGTDTIALQAAGEEALDEIERLDKQLSLYRPDSEVCHLNLHAAKEPVRVSPELFALLQHAQRLSEETGGAFDITIAPLVRCWGFMGGNGKLPGSADLKRCRAQIGMHLVTLNPADSTVRFEREGVMLDLGAIGKGYAVGKAAAILHEVGVASALIHGGTSTVFALGRPPDEECWKIAIQLPSLSDDDPATTPESNGDSIADPPLPHATSKERSQGKSERLWKGVQESEEMDPRLIVRLCDEALSVSAVRGKFFKTGDKEFGHVLDPRTGRPAVGTALAAVVVPSATESDALSTALLVLGAAGHNRISRLRPGMRTWLVSAVGGSLRLETGNVSLENAQENPPRRL